MAVRVRKVQGGVRIVIDGAHAQAWLLTVTLAFIAVGLLADVAAVLAWFDHRSLLVVAGLIAGALTVTGWLNMWLISCIRRAKGTRRA